MFDLSAYFYNESVDYEVLSPVDSQPTGWIITLAGPSHSVTLEAQEASLREQLARTESWQKKASDKVAEGKGVAAPNISMAEFRADRAKTVATRVLKSTPFQYNGSEISLTPENAFAILSDLKVYSWLTEGQLYKVIDDNKNFMKLSA